MKRIYFSIITIVFVICIVGCEKNKIDDNASLLSNYIVKTGTKSGSIIHVTNICKENGKPIKFMGVTVAVRYNYVSKTHSISSVEGSDIQNYNTYITCKDRGNERCRFNGHSYGTNPNPDDDWLNIDTNICVNTVNINAFIDQMLDTVDVRLTQTGQFTGSIICEELFPTQTDDFVTLRFETEWTGGNADGDANVEITVYYDPEQ